MTAIRRPELFATLPPEWPDDPLPAIHSALRKRREKVVVLDDDPTGTQTVYNVPVLTEWSVSSLETVLAEPEAIAYILTNSRSLPPLEAQTLNREIAQSLRAASQATGREFVVVSRSDSTLRGHYPAEVQALAQMLGGRYDGTLIVPFFLEGGRLTANDIHYVAEGDSLVPAAETEYARDATFGYRHSNLREWVSEKHGGRIAPHEVASVTLEEERRGGPEAVAARLSGIANGQVCVVNAVAYRDLEVFVAGLLRAEASGKRFVYRTAASFVRTRGGLAPRAPLTAADLVSAPGKNGGLIVAGSYIKKSTAQIEAVRALPGLVRLEVSVERLLDPARRDEEICRVTEAMNQTLSAGKDALVYTSRTLIIGGGGSAALQIGQTVSRALVEIVRRLEARPAWVIAKGGITASDVATKGLHIMRADVVGQAIPGVPIWRAGSSSRWPGQLYVIFPGNVGGPNSIVDMIQVLRGNKGR